MNIYRLAGKFEDIKRSAVRHSLIQIYDSSKITVEDCKKVIRFDENTVKLELAKGNVTIVGLDLKMKQFSEHGVIITGSLHSLGFDDDGKG